MVETKSQLKKKDSIKKKKKQVKNEIHALAKKKNNGSEKKKAERKKNVVEKNTKKNSNKTTPKKKPKKLETTTTVSSPSSSTKSKRSRNKISHDDNSASKEKKSPSTPKISDSNNKKKTPKETVRAKQQSSKNNPLLNVRVHRMRHLNFQPRGILCMAATPFHKDCTDYVAVSREGGTIELKSPEDKWRTISTIAGLSGKTVNVMTWVRGTKNTTKQQTSSISYFSDFHKSHTEIHNQNTCIGASKDGTIFVLDFAKAEFTSVIGSGGGGVFALVSLDEDSKSETSNGLVAAGCEDGSIRIYKVQKEDEKTSLVLLSTLPSAGSSILSLAWCREYDGIGMNGTVIYAGVADGTIRRYECKSKTKGKAHNVNESSMLTTKSTWRSNIRMTVESLDRSTPTFVWALRVLKDGTVISGDSLGHVQFWDGRTGTLLQSFEQNDKKADVLSVAVTSDERQVFASGIDTRLIAIERPSYEDRNGPSEWILANAQRPHTHDVKALCVCRVSSHEKKSQEILCSGGVDTKICTFVVTGLKFNRPTTRFPWPTCSPISVARDGRVLLLRRAKALELHRIIKDEDEPKNSTTKKNKMPLNRILEENKTHIGTFDIRGKYNTICSDISPDGKYIIVSTATDVLLFEVTYVEVEYDNTLRCEPKQIHMEDEFKTHCVVAIKFLSDSKGIICVDKHGNIRILRIQNSEDDIGTTEVTSTDVPYHHTARNINTSFPIHSIAVSKNDKMFATVRGGLGSGIVSLFVRNEEDDTITSYWTLPALESSVTCVSFLASEKIAVTCCNYATYVFDVKGRKLSDWSETIGFPATMPSELKKSFDFPSTIVAHPKDSDKFIIGSFGSFCVVSTSLGMPERCRTVPEKHVRKKRKKGPPAAEQHMKNSMTTNPNFTMCMRYNSMIHTDFVSENEMIVVEQPWLNVLASLPEIMERRIFGT